MSPQRSRLALRLPAAFVIAGALAAGPARAQDPAAAEVLFDRGMTEWKAGRVEQGCKAIAESERLDPRPGTLFTLATCETEWGRVATAWAHFGEYLALYERLPPDVQTRQGDRPRVAHAQRDKLTTVMPRLTLVLAPGAPAGTLVKRNGVVMSEASLGIALPVDSGEYLVTTEAPGSPVRQERVNILTGENKTVTLTVSAAAPATPPAIPPRATTQPLPAPPPAAPPPPDSQTPGRRTAAFVTGGLGVAGLALGGIAGGLILGKKSTLQAHCGTAVHSSDPSACDPTGVSAASGLTGLGVASTVGFVVGVAGVGTAVVLFARQPRAGAAQSGEGGRALEVGLLSAGSAGTTFGVRGGW